MKKLLKALVYIFSAVVVLAIGVVIQKQTSFFNRAFGKNADIHVYLGGFLDTQGSVWKNLAQGGEEKGRMLQSVSNQVASLHPNYIRIDHIFDYYDVVGKTQNGELTFNWQSLDLTLQDIGTIGAKPFISLSYMPLAISRGGVEDLPRDWGDWELVIQKTVEHISGKAGLGISDVYYEVWNEPDLFGKFKTEGDVNYLDLYKHSLLGASRAQNTLAHKIGGPSTTGYNQQWFSDLINLVSRESLRLDLLSRHIYSEDIGRFEKDIQEVRAMLNNSAGLNNIELIITESGITGENDSRYDSNFAAIHTLAETAVLEDGISKLFTFEIKDGPGNEKFWGRWGVLTHEKFGLPEKKPRFYALQFLNNMRGKAVSVTGEGSWIKAFAKVEDGIIRLLIVNYDPKGVHFESVPITFEDLPFLNFKYKRIDFGGKVTELSITNNSPTWKVVEGFGPNSAAILELSSF